MESFVNHLKSEFKKPLPGREVQYGMAHKVRQMREGLSTPGKSTRMAAVLALFYPKENGIYLTLMKRAERGTHSGQISFPGGGVEKGDKDLIYTALREANEEVGIIPNEVQILGQLTSLYISVSDSLVHPFVGFSHTAPRYSIDPSEVLYVIEAPLHAFLDRANLKTRDIGIGNQLILRKVPYFDIENHVVWGATAMIMNELLALIAKPGTAAGIIRPG